jgi:hypothetical protein
MARLNFYGHHDRIGEDKCKFCRQLDSKIISISRITPQMKWHLLCSILQEFGAEHPNHLLLLKWTKKDPFSFSLLITLLNLITGSHIGGYFDEDKQEWQIDRI